MKPRTFGPHREIDAGSIVRRRGVSGAAQFQLIMKLIFFLSKRAQKTLFAAGLALAIFPTGVEAFPAPQWMQGGHAARITGVACSPDGTMIASSSEDGTLKLWSTNGTLLRTLTANPVPSPRLPGRRTARSIAAGTYYGGYYYSQPGLGLTYLWQAPGGSQSAWTGASVSLVRASTNLFGKVTAVAFSTDSSMLASGCAAGSNFVTSVSDGSFVATRPAYNTAVEPAAVTSVAFSPNGMMASGCEDSTVCVYSTNSSWNLLWTSTDQRQRTDDQCHGGGLLTRRRVAGFGEPGSNHQDLENQ